MRHVTMFTDGACAGNPGPGGWCAILIDGERRRELSGYEPSSTNNRMELMAAIEGLRALRSRVTVDLHTDSQYLRTGMSEWLARWKRNGWRTAGRKPVKNEDLWRRLDEAARMHDVKWHWVKGHSGHEMNDFVDALAVEASLSRMPD